MATAAKSKEKCMCDACVKARKAAARQGAYYTIIKKKAEEKGITVTEVEIDEYLAGKGPWRE